MPRLPNLERDGRKKGLVPPTRIHAILGFRHSTAAPFNSYRNRVTVGPRVRSRQAGRVVSWRGSPYQAIVVGVGGGGQIRLCLTRVPSTLSCMPPPPSSMRMRACSSPRKKLFSFLVWWPRPLSRLTSGLCAGDETTRAFASFLSSRRERERREGVGVTV